MFNKILVPLDGSELAESVLPHVYALAQNNSSQIILLHVVEQNNPPEQVRPVDPLNWRLRQVEAENYLEKIARRFQTTELTGSIETVLLEGQAAERIIELAHQRQVDLIVVSSHGRNGLSGWNVSSVVQKIILRAYTSIFITRAYQPGQPGLTDLRYRRILVPLDGSQRAEHVVSLLTTLSQAHQAQILLAHVVVQPEIPRRVPLTPEEQELRQRLVELNHEEITRYFDHLKSHLPSTVETHIAVSEKVIATLNHVAEERQVDLVVLSAHGYSAAREYPYGSVSVSFIAYGATPLLIVQDLSFQEITPNPAEASTQQVDTSGRILTYDKPTI